MTTVVMGSTKVERAAARCAEYYSQEDKNPIKMARMFRDLVDMCSVRKAADLTEIHDASISNYMGLLRLPSRLMKKVANGEMNFKLARALCRMEQYRAREFAAFIERTGGPKGDEVEAFVTAGRKYLHLSPEEVLIKMRGRPEPETGDAPSRVARFMRTPVPAIPQATTKQMLDAAAFVEMIRPASDLERLPMLTTLRILKSRVDQKIKELE